MENNVAIETELLERARHYDRQALAQIYDLYSPSLYRYALRLLGDTDQAEDAVAETFSRFLHALRNQRGPRDYLQAYLFRTLHNFVVDHYRKRPEMKEELDDQLLAGDPEPEAEVQQRQEQDRLRAAIRKLTPDQQQVVALKYLQGWENDEIAMAIGKPVGAVKSLQHRGLARLQRWLEKEEQK